MPIREYPFELRRGYSCPMPWLPIRFLNPGDGSYRDTWGIVDTGAIGTTVPGWVADAIHLDLSAATQISGLGAGGTMFLLQCRCDVHIFARDAKSAVNYQSVVHSIVGQTLGVLRNLPFPLLGVEDFLKDFVVHIDYPQRNFSILRSPTTALTATLRP